MSRVEYVEQVLNLSLCGCPTDKRNLFIHSGHPLEKLVGSPRNEERKRADGLIHQTNAMLQLRKYI